MLKPLRAHASACSMEALTEPIITCLSFRRVPNTRAEVILELSNDTKQMRSYCEVGWGDRMNGYIRRCSFAERRERIRALYRGGPGVHRWYQSQLASDVRKVLARIVKKISHFPTPHELFRYSVTEGHEFEKLQGFWNSRSHWRVPCLKNHRSAAYFLAASPLRYRCYHRYSPDVVEVLVERMYDAVGYQTLTPLQYRRGSCHHQARLPGE